MIELKNVSFGYKKQKNIFNELNFEIYEGEMICIVGKTCYIIRLGLMILCHSFDNGIETTEITFGSNLMEGELVVDIGKMNKMFRIMRGGHIRDFYQNSMFVSSYMRHAVTEKQQSVWIAQRNGRT